MPVRQRKDGSWWWGGKGPFNSRKKAVEVSKAAYASGYRPGRPTKKKAKAKK